ncbi:hypothetical protein PPL_08665 [Heterostelium album PN500]|uniref:BCNT-C domain-containing protein n=1 Tax=Heterostelium pallidum (strain ATCC 26659 / Pp 5 / PN500) TaxID=670386 RepID=D3BJE0_HETP5|nr:hypothetical protein PPL_08665 [Heterostelium album PN500]EFA78020.1 hypothetical protein PPL_08665 [Heterostelium album PN500]|eukprot:XP_020430148.1 hypothetical protein PPL_08665 [Heterostelium album PN500]
MSDSVIRSRTRANVVIPKLQAEDAYSEDEEDDDDYEPSEGEQELAENDTKEDEKKSKRKLATKAKQPKKKQQKKKKGDEDEEEEEDEEAEAVDEEEEVVVDLDGEKETDDKDSKDGEKKEKTLEEMMNEIPDTTPKSAETTELVKEKTVEVFEFAGQKVVKEREVVVPKPAAGIAKKKPGLDSVLSNLGGKPKKLTTLQKSQLDWDSYKDSNILEKNDMERQAKNGYLEKQAFLQRTDQNLANTIKNLSKKK